MTSKKRKEFNSLKKEYTAYGKTKSNLPLVKAFLQHLITIISLFYERASVLFCGCVMCFVNSSAEFLVKRTFFSVYVDVNEARTEKCAIKCEFHNVTAVSILRPFRF